MKHWRKAVWAFVLLTVLFAFGAAAVSLADIVKIHDSGDAYLFDRSGNVFGRAKAGESYELLEENGSWYRIRTEDGEGWVAADTSEIIDDAPEGSVTINRILRSGLPNERIAVDDDLSAYSPANNMFYEFSQDKDIRVIILEREAPQKEFSSLTSYPPFEESGFPDDFTGTDAGSPQIWLRADLMNRIPPVLRASSLQNATYLVIFETYYEHGGTISVTNYEYDNSGEAPVFETVEEMLEYLETHTKEAASITYYPKFSAYLFASIYDRETKDFSFFQYHYTPAMRFARNPEASDQWERMIDLYQLLYFLGGENGPDATTAKSIIEMIDFVPETKKDLWITFIDAEEYSTAVYSISEYFWSMANDLKDLDPSEENRQNYEMLIQNRDIGAFALYANYCEYSGFDRSVESIEESKDYISEPDYGWMEQAIEETIAWFNN